MFFLVSGHPINSHRISWCLFPETTRSVNFMILCLDSPFGFAPGTFLTVGLATGRLEIHLPDSLSSKKCCSQVLKYNKIWMVAAKR